MLLDVERSTPERRSAMIGGWAATAALVRLAGVMAVVLESGEVCPGDAVGVVLPARPHRPLAAV